MFKKCSVCGKIWSSLEDLLNDPEISYLGAQHYRQGDKHLLIFDHTAEHCGTSIGVDSELVPGWEKMKPTTLTANAQEVVRPLSFLQKIEAAIRVLNGPRKTPRVVPPAPSEGAKQQVGFAQLTETRKLVPLIKKELDGTDPFYFNNTTWVKFLKHVAPQLFVALLVDMGVVPRTRRQEFQRFLFKQIKPK